MPQNQGVQLLAVNPAGKVIPVQCDSDGFLAAPETTNTTLHITAATVVKATPGRVISFTVVAAGAAGTINDCATTGAVAATNEICVTPATVGNYPINFPANVGIVVTPGAAQIIAINWE